jgi:hypothetical protein
MVEPDFKISSPFTPTPARDKINAPQVPPGYCVMQANEEVELECKRR